MAYGQITGGGGGDAKDLSTIDTDVQLKVWQSVVKSSSEYVCSGTGLILDRTATHMYLLTNLHMWLDKDGTFFKYMSADFKKEINYFLRLNPNMKLSGGKRKSDDAAVETRKSPRVSKETAFPSDIPQIVVEHLLPDTSVLAKVHVFSLHSGVCWRSSAEFDFAIFEAAVPPDVQLAPCETSRVVFPSMSVHIFGFPGILDEGKFDHSYAIIPAEITGWSGNKMTLSSLSTPGLSGSAIVCTKTGIPVGYLGGGFDGLGNAQYQSYGYTFHVMPRLPSSLPPDAEVKEEF